MRLDNKVMLCSALFIALVLLMGCSHPTNRWNTYDLGKEFERQGII